MLNSEQFDGGSVVSALGDHQLSAGRDGDGVRRSKPVIFRQQMTHEATVERHLRHSIVVAVCDDH